jgi:hypothetical protein
MSVATSACGELARSLFDRLREIEKRDPHGVERVVASMVEHLRSWRPESVIPLGELLPPEGPAVDPRATAKAATL